jgi:hypothetical protein
VTQKAIPSALRVIMRADDSCGIIGDACRALLDLHTEVATRAKPPVAKLVDWMIKFQFDNECDYSSPGRQFVQAHHRPTVTRPYATSAVDDLVRLEMHQACRVRSWVTWQDVTAAAAAGVPGRRSASVRSGARGHVGGEDVVRVPVKIHPGRVVVAHRRPRRAPARQRSPTTRSDVSTQVDGAPLGK